MAFYTSWMLCTCMATDLLRVGNLEPGHLLDLDVTHVFFLSFFFIEGQVYFTIQSLALITLHNLHYNYLHY